MQELGLAKEKSASAWSEVSKSIFLLDEQSQKIEELSDQMKELKAYHSTYTQTTGIASSATSLDGMAGTGHNGVISSTIVRKLIFFVSFL